MIISGVLFADEINKADGKKVNIVGANVSRFTNRARPGESTSMDIALFVNPELGENGGAKRLDVKILNTDGELLGAGQFETNPDYLVGGDIVILTVTDVQFARDWRYLLAVNDEFVTGFDVESE
jgi:hypothetical protein